MAMRSLSGELSKVLNALDGDAAKFMSIALNNERYRQVVHTIWKDPAAAEFILEGTNGFYIRRDDSPRKGPDKDKPYMVCVICAADALIRAELDTHRELIHLQLRALGLNTDEVRIVPARRGMKAKHPFRNDGLSDRDGFSDGSSRPQRGPNG